MTAEAVDATAGQTTVLVIDDNTSSAELLTAAFDREPALRGLGFAGSASVGLRMCQRLQPDVVVVDCGVAEGHAPETAGEIVSAVPGARVVLLACDPSMEGLVRAAAAGACAFLAKGTSLAAVIDTVRYAHRGVIEIDPLILAAFAEQEPPSPNVSPIPLLTRRQMDVLRLMAEGKDVRAVAKTLGISQNTCRGYVKAIHSRLEVHSQLEAVVIARQLGLLASSH